MLHSVEIITKSGSSLVVPLGETTNGYQIRDAEGLGPAKASFASSSVALLDGDQFQASRVESRNIILRLGLEPDFVNNTVATLRRDLYAYFTPQTEVQLRFVTDEYPVLEIDGRVESMEPAIFSADPEIVVSILCFQQVHLKALDANTPALNVVTDGTVTNIVYEGTVPVGFEYTTFAVNDMSNFAFHQDLPNRPGRLLEISGTIPQNSTLRISTIPGAKGAWLSDSGGPEYSILGRVAPNSDWLRLEPGSNGLRVFSTSASSGSLEYYNTYGGL